MKNKYSWGVDGYGRQFIINQLEELVMCCLPGSARYYVLVLNEQENES